MADEDGDPVKLASQSEAEGGLDDHTDARGDHLATQSDADVGAAAESEASPELEATVGSSHHDVQSTPRGENSEAKESLYLAEADETVMKSHEPRDCNARSTRGDPAAPDPLCSPASASDIHVVRFANFLRQLRGSVVRAWRMDLDMRGVGNVRHTEFAAFCKRRGFPGWVTKAIWSGLRPDGSGLPVELFEVAPREAANADALAQLLLRCCREKPSPSACWELLNTAGHSHLMLEEFRDACDRLGFNGSPGMVFRGLDTSGQGRLWQEEFVYLFRISRRLMHYKVLFRSSGSQGFGDWVRSFIGGFDVLLARMNLLSKDKNIGVLECVSLLHSLGFKGDAHALAVKAARLNDSPGRISAESLFALARHSGLEAAIGTTEGGSPMSTAFCLSPTSTGFTSSPRSPGGSRRKEVKAPGLIRAKFNPGPLGLVIDYGDNGHVKQVHEGGQAEREGVRVGMYIAKIDGEPFSREDGQSKQMLRDCIDGENDYVVCFRETPFKNARRIDPVEPAQRQKLVEVEETVEQTIEEMGYRDMDWQSLQDEVKRLVDERIISAAKSTMLRLRPEAQAEDLANDLIEEMSTQTRNNLREKSWYNGVWSPSDYNCSAASPCRHYFSFPVANALRRTANHNVPKDELFPGCEDRPALQEIKTKLDEIRQLKEERERQEQEELEDADIDAEDLGREEKKRKAGLRKGRQKQTTAPSPEGVVSKETAGRIRTCIEQATADKSPEELLKAYDENCDEALDVQEFTNMVRQEFKVGRSSLTSEDIEGFVFALSADGEGRFGLDELNEFISQGFDALYKAAPSDGV